MFLVWVTSLRMIVSSFIHFSANLIFLNRWIYSWKQSRCQSADEWVKKKYYTYTIGCHSAESSRQLLFFSNFRWLLSYLSYLRKSAISSLYVVQTLRCWKKLEFLDINCNLLTKTWIENIYVLLHILALLTNLVNFIAVIKSIG